MGHATDFDDPRGEQRFIAGIVIDHQMTLPATQKSPCMRTAAPGLIIEYGDAWPIIEIAAAIGP